MPAPPKNTLQAGLVSCSCLQRIALLSAPVPRPSATADLSLRVSLMPLLPKQHLVSQLFGSPPARLLQLSTLTVLRTAVGLTDTCSVASPALRITATISPHQNGCPLYRSPPSLHLTTDILPPTGKPISVSEEVGYEQAVCP